MKRRNVMSVILAAALVMGTVAGCGGKKADEPPAASAEKNETKTEAVTEAKAESGSEAKDGEKKVIRVAWWGSQERADKTTKVCEMYMEEHPDVEIQVEFSDFSGYFDKLSVMAAGGTMPDIYQNTREHLKEFADKGLMLGLNQYIESGALDLSDVPESIASATVFEGENYGIVLGSNAPVMMYDPAITEQAGVEIKDAMPWSELVEAAKTIYEKTGAKMSFDSGDPGTSLLMVVRGKGYQMYSEDGKTLGFPDSSPVVEYFTRYRSGLDDGYIVNPEIYVERDVTAAEQRPMIDGVCWNDFGFSNVQTPWNAMEAAGKTLKMVSFPTGDNDVVPCNYLRAATLFNVSAKTKYPEVCADFLNYFLNSVEAYKVLNVERGIPVAQNVVKEIGKDADGCQKLMLDFMTEVPKYCSSNDILSPAATPQVEDILKSLLEQVGYGKITPQEAGDQFFSQANELLAK